MKNNKLWVTYIGDENFGEPFIVQEAGTLKKLLKHFLNNQDKEYKCYFTKKKFWLKGEDILTYVLFLSSSQKKINTNKKEVRRVLEEKKEDMLKALKKKKKNTIGFQNQN